MRPSDGRLHFSDLKQIAETPLQFKHGLEHEREETKSLKLGRALHAKWLQGIEPWVYEGRRDKRIKEYQAALEERGGEIPLNDAEYTQVLGMVRALDMHPAAMRIKAMCTEFEKSMAWERGGIQCGGTLDMCGPGVLAELKSCESRRIHPMAFQRQARWYKYPEQISWYAVGNGTVLRGSTTPWPDSYIISVESKAPHDVVVHHCGNLLLDQANANIEQWLITYKACKADNNWPGHAIDVVEFDAEVEFGPGDADD